MRMIRAMSGKKLINYLSRVGIALSVLLNVILFGPSNQTFSARNWMWKRKKKPNLVPVIDWIAYAIARDQDHCQTSWVYWRVRKDVQWEHYKSKVGPTENKINEPIYY